MLNAFTTLIEASNVYSVPLAVAQGRPGVLVPASLTSESRSRCSALSELQYINKVSKLIYNQLCQLINTKLGKHFSTQYFVFFVSHVVFPNDSKYLPLPSVINSVAKHLALANHLSSYTVDRTIISLQNSMKSVLHDCRIVQIHY